MIRQIFRTVGAFLLLMAVSSPLVAQTFRGTIFGTVTDPTGAVIPGARVTIRSLDTGLVREATTDDTGYYFVAELPIGNYSVTVEQTGFQRAVVTGIRVEVAAQRRVDVLLAPGALEQITEVVAEAPLIESTTNVLGGTVEAKQATELPISGRDFSKLLVLVPGATGSPDGITDFPGAFGLFSTNGNRGRANNFLLDGTDMNDGYRNLPAINQAGVFGTPASLLPLDVIAETRILTHFEPEYGRNGGAVVNIVTRSGSNELHGSIYEYFRNDRLNAHNFFNNVGPKDKFRNNNFGFSLGGPVRRDSTFFFVGYEGQRERGAITTLASVPSDADFAAAIAAIGGAGNINPVIQNLLSLCASSGACSGSTRLWPAPTPGREGLTLNSVVPAPFSNRLDSIIVKVDHNFNPSNLLTTRYFFGDTDQSFPLGLAGGNNLPGTNTDSPVRVQLLSLSYVRVFSPTRINEFRFGWNRYHQDFLAQNRDVFRNPADTLNLNMPITHPRDFGLTTLQVAGFAQLGSSPFSNPRGRIDTNWHLVDSYSWQTGRHHFKVGVEFRRTFINSFNDSNFRGKLSFDTLEDFLLGDVAGGRALIGDTTRGTFQNSWAGYLQDSWRLSPRLTFNWGLRYDYFGVLDEENNNFSRYDPAAGLQLLGSPGFPRLYERDFNNFSPRLSFAWDPWGDGKTVLRAGWGLFYDAYSQDFFIGQIPWNAFNTGVAYNPIGADASSPVLISFSPIATLDPAQPLFDPASFATDTTDLTVVDPNLRTPYIQNFNLNLQRELRTNTVLQIGYVGSAGRKLFRTSEINQVFDPNVGARPFDAAAPLCPATSPTCPVDSGNVPFIVNRVETTASSSFHSLQVSLNQRNWRGWTHSANYTWGHSIDTASDGIESVPNQSTPNNSHAPQLERASANFDVRHRFVWSWIYDVPRFSDTARRLTEGWQFSGILTLMTGHPYHINFIDDFDTDGIYDFILRPDLVGNPFEGAGGPERFLNLNAFAVPCTLDPLGNGTVASCLPGTLHYGNLGRNVFRGPNFRNFDFSIAKRTSLTERLSVVFRADFFNVFNRTNFASPTLPAFIALAGFQGIDPVTGRGGFAGTVAGGGAGCPADNNCFLPLQATADTGIGYPSLGGGAPRNIQFSLKFIF